VSDGPPSRPDTPRGIEPRLRQGPDGPVWRFRVRWRDPRSGRRLVEELDTIDDALDFQAHLRLARRRGVLSELDRGTTRLDAFVERWWATWAAHNLTRPTLRVYAAVWNLHGLPRVGALPLREITPATIDELGAALEADGVGPSAIRKLMTMGEIIDGSKTGRRLRTPTLFGPVRADLAAHRLALARPAGCTLLFARADGKPWRETDYRNWRRRHFKPAVARLGLPITRPYDLRHASASLLLHAGWPLTEVAEHLGHSVAVLSDTYAHVIAELRGQRPVPVETAIERARRRRLRPQNAPSRPAGAAASPPSGTKKAPNSGALPGSPLPDSNRRPLPYHGSPASSHGARRRQKDLQRRKNGDAGVVGSVAQRRLSRV
jgi:hypothetical protein